MRYLFLLLCLTFLTPLAAFAGEGLAIGTITSTGAEVDNSTTAVPFVIPPKAKLTIQCDAAAYIAVNTLVAVTAANGLKVQTDQPWQTSTNGQLLTISSIKSGVIRVISVTGTVNCKVFPRQGDE